MKMKMRYMILLLCFLWAGCNENEIIVFGDQPGINFLRYNSYNGWNDEAGDIFIERNFGLFMDQWETPTDTIRVWAKLEGMMSQEPLRVRLTYAFDPANPYVELVFRDDYVFKPHEYLTEFLIVVKRPPERDRVFNINLTFDYEHSDVVPGSNDRQVFRLTISDRLTFDMLRISQELWDNMIAPSLGAYSNVKMRFMSYALQSRDFSGMAGGVTANQRQTILNRLNEYNAAHPGNPLRDENGDVVVFEP